MWNYISLILLLLVGACQGRSSLTEAAAFSMSNLELRVSYDTSPRGVEIQWVKPAWEMVDMRLYRGDSPDTLELFKEAVNQTDFIDYETMVNIDYFYQLKGFDINGNLIGTSSVEKGRRAYRSFEDALEPTHVSASEGLFAQRIEILWVGDPADQFRIYRSSTKDGEYTLLKEFFFSATEQMMYVDSVNPQEVYWYKIAVLAFDGKNVLEKYMVQEPVRGFTIEAPLAPQVTRGKSQDYDKISLVWQEDQTADFYKLYRSLGSDGKRELIVPYTEDTAFVDTTLPILEGSVVNGKFQYPRYYYYVSTVKEGSESAKSDGGEGWTYYSKDFKSIDVIKPLLETSINAPYILSLMWKDLNKNNNEKVSYNIYIKNDDGTKTMLSENYIASESVQYIEKEDGSMVPYLEAVEAGDTEGQVWNKFRIGQEYDTSKEYGITVRNLNAGDLTGDETTLFYAMTMPQPPVVYSVSVYAVTNITNISYTPRDCLSYYYNTTTKKTHKNVFGSVIQEWTIEPQTGYIDLKFGRGDIAEKGTIFKIYRSEDLYGEYALVGEYDPDEVELDEDGNVIEKPEVTDNVYTYRDTNFAPSELKGDFIDGRNIYPQFYYKVSLVNGESETPLVNETFTGSLMFGKTVDPNDISGAPEFVTVPGHWSFSTGFLSKSLKWAVGETVKPGAELISGKTGVNHLWLTWGKAKNTDRFNIYIQNGNSLDPDGFKLKAELDPGEYSYYFNTEGTLYVFTDSWISYSPNSMAFIVESVNTRVEDIPRGQRGILYQEPAKNPFWI